MIDQNDAISELFNKLFNQLDFEDQVYILQCMNEMIPDDHAVIDIRNLKREEADQMPKKKKKSTRQSSRPERPLTEKEKKQNQAVMEQIIYSIK